LPNLCIVDFSYGHTGNTHDEQTQLAYEHKDILDDGEWVWADSAYLVIHVFCYKVTAVDKP
jgi:hypothetical protein